MRISILAGLLLALAACATQPSPTTAPLRMGSAPQQSVTLTPPAGVACPASVHDGGLTTVTMSGADCVFAAASGLTDVNGNPVSNPYLSGLAQQTIKGLLSQGWAKSGSSGVSSIIAGTGISVVDYLTITP